MRRLFQGGITGGTKTFTWAPTLEVPDKWPIERPSKCLKQSVLGWAMSEHQQKNVTKTDKDLSNDWEVTRKIKVRVKIRI